MMWRYFLVVSMTGVLLSMGCAPDEPIFISEPPEDPDDGPYGVAVVERDFRVRFDDRASTLVYLPTDGPDSLADGPFPTMLFLHGGLVEAERYGWIIEHMTRRGFVVLAPSHQLDLAIFSTGNGADLLDAVQRANERPGDLLEGRIAPGPALAAGHSLGGVIATKTWLRVPDKISHLLLLQSIPDANDAEKLAEAPVEELQILAVAGGRDGRISVDEIVDELPLFGVDVPLAVVEGLNHFQLVDGPPPSRYEADRPATISTETGRHRLLVLTDLFLQSYIDDGDTKFGDPSIWPQGVVSWEAFQEGRQ